MRELPGNVTKREIDSGQFPDAWEYEEVPDVETLMGLKTGFVLKLAEIRLGSWRIRPSNDILYVEYWNGTSWIEQGKFTA